MYRDFATITFILFVFCAIGAILSGGAAYITWMIIFGLLTWIFRMKS